MNILEIDNLLESIEGLESTITELKNDSEDNLKDVILDVSEKFTEQFDNYINTINKRLFALENNLHLDDEIRNNLIINLRKFSKLEVDTVDSEKIKKVKDSINRTKEIDENVNILYNIIYNKTKELNKIFRKYNPKVTLFYSKLFDDIFDKEQK